MVTCGPPIMIKFALVSLKKPRFTFDQVYATLEKRMMCGVGERGEAQP